MHESNKSVLFFQSELVRRVNLDLNYFMVGFAIMSVVGDDFISNIQ